MICKSRIIATLVTVGTLASGMAAYGQALPQATDVMTPFRTEGNWNVFVNTTRGTCFAERVTETSVLQLGVTKTPTLGYIGVFTQAPTDLRSGQIQQINIAIGGRNFVGEVTEAAGNIRGGFSGGYVTSEDPGFIEEVARARSMVATISGREPLEIDLTGTSRAIAAVRTCNSAQGG